MKSQQSLSQHWDSRPTVHPLWAIWLRRVDAIAQILGSSAMIVGHGLRPSGIIPWELGMIPLLSMMVISLAIFSRFQWSLKQSTFAWRYLWTVSAAVSWVAGLLIVLIIAPALPDTNGAGPGGPRWWWCVHLSEFILAAYSISGVVQALRMFTSKGFNPAILLVSSFGMLIGIGTAILMLPVCRTAHLESPFHSATFLNAFFTSTSACCVTGLTVVNTSTYWSPTGQFAILCLFQIGGLGIMTFSAFFAAIAGRNIRLGEFATLRDLLASDGVGDMRQLIYAILGLTFGCELIGAILLLPLFGGLPISQRLWMSLFHSVSAFCNAGFSLTENSFVGLGQTWCVSGVLAALIICGGLGFGVMYNLSTLFVLKSKDLFAMKTFRLPRQRPRLRLDTKLVLMTTTLLLISGWVAIYLLERTGPQRDAEISLSDAWFQSVTLRTAGFNTVDLGQLQPSTKLIAIFLMVVGASPGSTGGGIKTAVFAIAVVGLLSVLRGRSRVEVFRRTISGSTINRALAIVFVSIGTIMMTTLLLVIFEGRPELILDHLFEAASAVGTVGVSTTVLIDTNEYAATTLSLTTPSRYVIILAMFLGRVGPLTLLLALAGEGNQARYEYPVERVTLG